MKYILGVFGVIVLILLVVILVVRSGPSKPVGDVQTGEPQVNLAEYESKPATVSLTTRGQVTADETRRAIRITVSQQERAIEILEGYDEAVVSRQTFPNNSDAYKIFLSALSNAGFTREQETEVKDERGVCPFGRRYVFKLQDGSQQVFRAWTTSCRNGRGSFGGNLGVARRLFEQQIPEYSTVTRGVRL
jgi:hypothetical protein